MGNTLALELRRALLSAGTGLEISDQLIYSRSWLWKMKKISMTAYFSRMTIPDTRSRYALWTVGSICYKAKHAKAVAGNGVRRPIAVKLFG